MLTIVEAQMYVPQDEGGKSIDWWEIWGFNEHLVPRRSTLNSREGEILMKRFVKMFLAILIGVSITISIISVSFAGEYNEAPMLHELVKKGIIPPIEKRLPNNPMIVKPVEGVGIYGGTLKTATTGMTDFQGLCPGWLGEPLILLGPDQTEVLSNLAERYEHSDDGKVFRFYLRKGIKWSDGEPFTADDIIFWYRDVLLNKELTPAIPASLMADGKPVDVKKLDEFTVEFHFAKPQGLFDNFYILGPDIGFQMTAYPKHYLKQFHPSYSSLQGIEDAAKKAGFQFWYQLFQEKASQCLNPDLPVLSAWKLAAKPSTTGIVLERNPYYWKVDTKGNQLPYIDKISFDIIGDPEIIKARTLSGDLDFEFRHLAFSDYPLFKENQASGKFRVLNWLTGATGLTLFPNQTLVGDDTLKKLLQDVRFRTALSLAINRDEINEIVYLGQADPAYKTVLPEKTLWNRRDVANLYIYDVAKANRLLDQLGLSKRDKSGFRLRPDGKTLTLTIEVFNLPDQQDAAQMVATYWNQIGIKTTTKLLPYELWWTRIGSSEFQIVGYMSTHIGWLNYPSFSATSRNTYWAPLWGLWYEMHGEKGEEPPASVRRLQQLFEQVKITADRVKRAKLCEDLLLTGAQNVFTIPVAGPYPAVFIVKSALRNVPNAGYTSWPLSALMRHAMPEQFFFSR